MYKVCLVDIDGVINSIVLLDKISFSDEWEIYLRYGYVAIDGYPYNQSHNAVELIFALVYAVNQKIQNRIGSMSCM